MDSFESGETVGAGAEKPDIPSCLGCRRRKLKCSREQPSCSHCRRLAVSCEYDLSKSKPGVKAGAISSLSRRVDALESALLEKSNENSWCQNVQSDPTSHAPSRSLDVLEVLSMLTTELQKLNPKPDARSQVRSSEALLDHATASPTTSLSSSRYTIDRHDRATQQNDRPRKRRRVDSCGNPNVELLLALEENIEDTASSLPRADLLEDVINVYFDVIQPWVPILHETQFRLRLHNLDLFPKLIVILHAMVVAALRFVDNPECQLSAREIEQQTIRSRRLVVLMSMETLSVESLQALVIVAFTDIGNSEASRAWSIIGSLTRTVEYLQLTVESDHHTEEPLLRPLPTIPQAKDWTQEEERRRVFWLIFCLDRFCSVTTGWNTSLTSNDVRRRLPADGGLWHKSERVTTPFFGIWDKSVAKIGNSIAFMPGNYPSPEKSQDTPDVTPTTSGAQAGRNDMDITTIGAFAYRIEATESLSRVTTYFLQQRISFQDKKQVNDWLTRFKELDLRLVHWKMFLPQRWKDSNISRQPDFVNMDPNLTLAHVTHNTSMILLHQRIAYPDIRWFGTLRLPSSCSAETCQVAAIETTSITQKYLKYTPKFSPVANQYAFCIFISARVLLIHWRRYEATLASEFWTLVQALDEMAERWAGPMLRHTASNTLAGNYAKELRWLHSKCEADPQFEIDVLGYLNGTTQCSPDESSLLSQSSNSLQQEGRVPSCSSHLQPPNKVSESIRLASSPSGVPATLLGQNRPADNEMDFTEPSICQSRLPAGADLHEDRMSAISHILMDEGFMNMDRIISLDDTIFTAPEYSANGLTWGSNENIPAG